MTVNTTASPIALDKALGLYGFRATLVNLLTREEICIDGVAASDRYADVVRAIRRTYTARWEIFETWQIDG